MKKIAALSITSLLLLMCPSINADMENMQLYYICNPGIVDADNKLFTCQFSISGSDGFQFSSQFEPKTSYLWLQAIPDTGDTYNYTLTIIYNHGPTSCTTSGSFTVALDKNNKMSITNPQQTSFGNTTPFGCQASIKPQDNTLSIQLSSQ